MDKKKRHAPDQGTHFKGKISHIDENVTTVLPDKIQHLEEEVLTIHTDISTLIRMSLRNDKRGIKIQNQQKQIYNTVTSIYISLDKISNELFVNNNETTPTQIVNQDGFDISDNEDHLTNIIPHMKVENVEDSDDESQQNPLGFHFVTPNYNRKKFVKPTNVYYS